MEKKNDAKVTIYGKKYCIAGNEDIGYLRKIADQINAKHAEIRAAMGNNIINDSDNYIWCMINITDDYLKLKEKAEALEKENRLLSADNHDLRKKLGLTDTKK